MTFGPNTSPQSRAIPGANGKEGRLSMMMLLAIRKTASKVAWTYPQPPQAFTPIKNHVAFYAWAMDECSVDGERVQAQPGRFYGGWIIGDIVGSFKEEPGTSNW